MLEGQVAVVTGAGRGIGKEIALRFAREGADIAVIDVNVDGAAATAREVEAAGRRSSVTQADVSDFRAVRAAIAKIATDFGRIDILVNNAGIEKRAPFLEILPERSVSSM